MQGPKHTPNAPVANRTRLAILERLRSDSPATLDELAAAAGVHRNTIRAHAEALEQAGLIERTAVAEHRGAGRPPKRYRLAEAGQTEPDPLAQLLGAALSDARLSPRQARRMARLRAAAAKRLQPRRRASREVEQQLADLGFRATVTRDEVTLDHCPCPVVSPENPAVVCALVSGTVDGTLERLGEGLRIVGASHDPAARRCRLALGEDRETAGGQ